MICPRCLNQDSKYLYKFNNQVYCRKCVGFKRVFAGETLLSQEIAFDTSVDYKLNYKLTVDQLAISKEILSNFLNGKNSTVKAVCGAGKTEIVYETIKVALNAGKRVCFTTPRKELVVELGDRISSQFVGIIPSIVYGGHIDNLDSQLVICTTHQLFRYYQAFDLLILDELDAFPYKGNIVLNNILKQSIRGSYIFMSATLRDNDNTTLCLNKRYHGYKLPVPKCLVMSNSLSIVLMVGVVKMHIRKQRCVFVYVPTIEATSKIYKLLKFLQVKVAVTTSKSKNVQQTVELLRKGGLDVIVTTTILERGITVDNVQVIVMWGHHHIYDTDTLIQISGRVGRKMEHPKGNVLILTNHKTRHIKECIKIIQKDNV